MTKPAVLVVDDDRDTAEIVSEVLNDSGFSAKPLTDPAKTVDIISKERFDLIILDLQMFPDGLMVADKVQSLQSYPKILFCTAARNPLKGYEVLRKPFEVEALIGKIRDMLVVAS